MSVPPSLFPKNGRGVPSSPTLTRFMFDQKKALAQANFPLWIELEGGRPYPGRRTNKALHLRMFRNIKKPLVGIPTCGWFIKNHGKGKGEKYEPLRYES